jgi:hypothetical protein
VHTIGAQLAEQAGVVRDGEHAQVALLGHRLDPPGDIAQGVDVEAGVDLVEDGELGLEHGELERLRPLLLAAGELDVHAPLQELLADGEALRFRVESFSQAVGLAAPTADGGAEEVDDADTGNLDRVLHGEEEPLCGALPRREAEQLLAVERHRPVTHLVLGPAHEGVGEGRLPGPIGPHQRVHLARGDLEVDPAQDVLPVDGNPQAGDPQRAHAFVTTTSSPSILTSKTRTGWVAGSVAGSPVSSENVEPCFGHSISRSSSHTSPSDSE